VAWIGRQVEVRETKDKIEMQLDARNIVTHERIPDQKYQRSRSWPIAHSVTKGSSAAIRTRKNKPSPGARISPRAFLGRRAGSFPLWPL
jgi:hypothetical protein